MTAAILGGGGGDLLYFGLWLGLSCWCWCFRVKEVMCGLIQQACEKIDRTRAVGGAVFHRLLYLKPEVPAIPSKSRLMDVFPE